MKKVFKFWQETNSFGSLLTTTQKIKEEGFIAPEAMKAHFLNTKTEVGGLLDQLGHDQLTFLPSFYIFPCGPMEHEGFEWYVDQLLKGLDKNPSPSSMLLAVLHGCLTSTREDDTSGYLLETLKQRWPDQPILASLDLHAHLTDRIVRNLELIVGYRTFPHIDLYETGERLAHFSGKWESAGEKPRSLTRYLPFIVPADTGLHTDPPLKAMWEGLLLIEEKTGWPASYFAAHPWIDAEDAGVTLVAYAHDEDYAWASDQLDQVATDLWQAKDILYVDTPDLHSTWQQMEQHPTRPMILVDSGDVVFAGSPGDSTALLSYLSSSPTALRCLCHIIDPHSADWAKKYQAGDEVSLEVGATWTSDIFKPVPITGKVVNTAHDPYMASGDYAKGISFNPGARLAVQWNQHVVVITEKQDPGFDPNFYRALDLDLTQFDVIAVKSFNTFRPCYKEISEEIFRANTPGASRMNLMELPFKKRRVHPLVDCGF